jgi:hypothetical protein
MVAVRGCTAQAALASAEVVLTFIASPFIASRPAAQCCSR